MPVTTRTISGILRDQSGALLTDHALTICRATPIESIDDDVTVVADALVQLRSHASTAAWSAALYPGDHLLTLRTVRGQVTVPFAVPSGTGALDFADLSPQMPEVTPAYVLTAQSAATAATDRALDTAAIPANGGPEPSRPWLYVTGANGAPEAMTGYTAAALVTDATHGQCIGITGSATVASRARTRLVTGRVYQATFRARRTVAATGSAPVSFVVRCWQADGTTQTTAITARNALAIDTGDGWVETTVTLSLDVAGVDHTIAAGSVLARPFVFVGTASDGQLIVSQVALADITDQWFAEQASADATTQAGVASAAAVAAQGHRDAAAAITGAGSGQGADGSDAAPFWSFASDQAAGFYALGGGAIGVAGLGQIGPVGPLSGLLDAASEQDAQIALGMDARRVFYPTAGRSYPVFGRDSLPAYHYALPLSDQNINLDLSGLTQHKQYLFINAGRVRSTITLDLGPEGYFVAPHINPEDFSVRSLTLTGGESAIVTRTSTGPYVISPLGQSAHWAYAGGLCYYLRQPDGTYRMQYRRTANISASVASTVSLSGWSFDSATVRYVAAQPSGSGTVPPGMLPIITELGSATGIGSHQFKIHNPNAATWTVPVTVEFEGVIRL